MNASKESTDAEYSTLFDKVSTLETNLETKRETHSTLAEKVTTLEGKLEAERSAYAEKIYKLATELDCNQQEEHRDTLVFSGPAIPVFSSNENCKTIVYNIFRDNTQLEIHPQSNSKLSKTSSSVPSFRIKIIANLTVACLTA